MEEASLISGAPAEDPGAGPAVRDGSHSALVLSSLSPEEEQPTQAASEGKVQLRASSPQKAASPGQASHWPGWPSYGAKEAEPTHSAPKIQLWEPKGSEPLQASIRWGPLRFFLFLISFQTKIKVCSCYLM